MASRIGGLRRWLGELRQQLGDTLDEYSKDRGDLVAAALAFYALRSLAPLIIVAVAMAGFVLGKGTAREEVFTLVRQAMGADAAATIDEWVQHASRAGALASTIGAVLTLLAASRFTSQLRNALNQIWNVKVTDTKGFKSSARDFIVRQLFALGLVLASGPILLGVFASRAVLVGFGSRIVPQSLAAGVVIQLVHFLFSLLLVTATSLVVFRYVPDIRIGWPALLRGAMLTSILFNLGNLLVGIYLGKAAVGEAYGAAGSVVVVILWLHYSAQMFLLGAEFTQVCETRRERSSNSQASGG
jgi:membrane protein